MAVVEATDRPPFRSLLLDSPYTRTGPDLVSPVWLRFVLCDRVLSNVKSDSPCLVYDPDEMYHPIIYPKIHLLFYRNDTRSSAVEGDDDFGQSAPTHGQVESSETLFATLDLGS